MAKKVVITIILIFSLIATLIAAIFPQTAELFGASVNDLNEFKQIVGFWIYPIIFFCISSVLLSWLGLYVGWNFARNNEWTLIPILISTYIGMILSLPIALVHLFRNNY